MLGKSKTSLLGSVPTSDKKCYFSPIMVQKNDANMAEGRSGRRTDYGEVTNITNTAQLFYQVV